MRVLSLFDGMSCGQLALNRAGIVYDKYYASEIEKASIKVCQHHFPNTIQVGDVSKISGNDFKDVNLLIGGSPCTDLSIAGKRLGLTTKENIHIVNLDQYLELKHKGFSFNGQSYLFWEFVRLKKEINPEYFFLENVNMKKNWENIITENLGVDPIKINSNLVSAQNRERLYWTNIPHPQIQNKGIKFSDIFPDSVSCGYRGRKLRGDNHYTKYLTMRSDNKCNCIVTSPHNTNYIFHKSGIYPMTPIQAEIMQTLPIGYTNVPGISETKRYKMIGNGWTIDVIKEFFKNINHDQKTIY